MYWDQTLSVCNPCGVGIKYWHLNNIILNICSSRKIYLNILQGPTIQAQVVLVPHVQQVFLKSSLLLFCTHTHTYTHNIIVSSLTVFTLRKKFLYWLRSLLRSWILQRWNVFIQQLSKWIHIPVQFEQLLLLFLNCKILERCRGVLYI